MFDKTDSGVISEEQLIKILNNKRGEPFSSEEVEFIENCVNQNCL
jgi:Ca2+-binding EF-hand superfamily protein